MGVEPSSRDQWAIIGEVERKLETTEGRAKIDLLVDHLRRIDDSKRALKALSRKMRSRPGIRLYTSIGHSKEAGIRIDVRKDGVSCGHVRLTSAKSRPFRPSKDIVLSAT